MLCGELSRSLGTGVLRPSWSKIPYDLFAEEISGEFSYKPTFSTRSGPDPDAVSEVAEVLVNAEHLVIYAGQGVHYAEAWPALRRLAELLAAPVTSSLGGKSAFPENHALSLGSGGRSMPRPVHEFLHNADVIFGIGCSFTNTAFGVTMPNGPKNYTLDA